MFVQKIALPLCLVPIMKHEFFPSKFMFRNHILSNHLLPTVFYIIFFLLSFPFYSFFTFFSCHIFCTFFFPLFRSFFSFFVLFFSFFVLFFPFFFLFFPFCSFFPFFVLFFPFCIFLHPCIFFCLIHLYKITPTSCKQEFLF